MEELPRIMRRGERPAGNSQLDVPRRCARRAPTQAGGNRIHRHLDFQFHEVFPDGAAAALTGAYRRSPRAEMGLNGKVALVTGTSTNIGGGIAEGLAAEGAALVCVDCREENAADCARYIKSTGGRAIGVTCDVTDESQVIAVVSAARESFEGIDILVNNAAIFNRKGVI